MLVSAETIERVLDVIPCPQFRLIVALARWGGLWIPSELTTLRWSNIDLANGRMIIQAPKTAHHKDGGLRIVPIFPEVIVGEGFIHTESDSINSCLNTRMGVTGLKQPPKTPRITMILPKKTQKPTHRPNCPPILSSLQPVGQTFPNLSGLQSSQW